ncbi:MAG: endonuclease/exonuclease/phosphatase family protein [Rhodobacteraceae bacterium]|jgi:hypothetical protein|nr:endonuclease/exonuclease/phosphatase family protein [Paracoccaceae bacterium]
MPFYNDLRPSRELDGGQYLQAFPRPRDPGSPRQLDDADKPQIIDSILTVRRNILPAQMIRRAEGNVIFGSWNLKEFGSYTQRRPEAFFILAEVIAAFDLLAIQEIRSDLTDLTILMRLLGPQWKYLLTDVTVPDSGPGPKGERSAYLYNAERVRLSGLVGEIALWPALTDPNPGGLRQLLRSPYVTGFRAGWKDFVVINLHLKSGDTAAEAAIRRQEVALLLQAIRKKAGEGWADNLILVGDMNLFHGNADAPTIKLITDAGFAEAPQLQGRNTNAADTQAYDRMFFRGAKPEYFNIEQGGVLRLFDHLYRPQDLDAHRKHLPTDRDDAALARYYRQHWRTRQISDHYPVWVSLHIDDAEPFLEAKRRDLVGA